MKYDRPVWQIMHACADAMPERFRYDDVKQWFEENFPDVHEATIRAHLIGLTDGGRAKHVQFAQRRPIFRRVSRGEYEVIPASESPREEFDAPVSTSKLKIARATNGRGHQDDEDEALEFKPPSPAPRSFRTVPPAPFFPQAVPPVADESNDESPADDQEADLEADLSVVPALTELDTPPDIVLLGSVGDRINVPAPAKEVFRSERFQAGRRRAEAADADWFVLSAEYGLITPSEWMSPDSRTLADMDTSYRITWAGWVAARLESLVGPVDGLSIEVDAPGEYVGPLFADLAARGALVRSVGGDDLQLDDEREPVAWMSDEAPETSNDGSGVDTIDDTTAGPDCVAHVTRYLTEPSSLVPADDLGVLPELPGVYAWWVDGTGARDLNRSLMLPLRPGLIFIGQVGGSAWQPLADPGLTLRDSLGRQQLQGRARASTFRMTLATVLSDELGMRTLDDAKLTAWMLRHLSVAVWPMEEPTGLRELERQVVLRLSPPLNVDHVPPTELRLRLSQLRRDLA